MKGTYEGIGTPGWRSPMNQAARAHLPEPAGSQVGFLPRCVPFGMRLDAFSQSMDSYSPPPRLLFAPIACPCWLRPPASSAHSLAII
eukprot:scaffold473331_cov51-Prasinocladus_malaysianus.AAC.2